MLLLNVVRAKNRLPMHFTAISQIKGSLSTTLGTGSDAPFGGDASSTYKVTPSANYKSSPTYDLAILDSQKFMRGVSAPVSLELVRHYLEQGWPVDFLFYLLVESIELDPTGHRNVSRFDIEDDESSRKYKELAAQLSREEISIVRELSEVGPTLRRKEVNTLSHLVTTGNSDLILKAIDNDRKKFQLYKPGEWVLTLEDDEGNTTTYLQGRRPDDKRHQEDESEEGKGEDEAKPDEAEPDEAEPDERFGEVTLRSPLGVLYFLGELARASVEDPDQILRLSDCEPLFVLRERLGGDTARAYVTVEHDGRTFYIPHNGELDANDPNSPAGRSMQALGFVSQLIALQKNADELPKTGTVTLVGN